MAGVSGSNRLPKDAQVIVSMLKEAGINDFEPRVVNQLLEFTYRYVTGILDEARVYAQHAKKKAIDLEDVKLASMLQLDRGALPVIKPHYGLRLPPDRHCLSACNYKLRSSKKVCINPLMTSKPQMQMSSSLLSSGNRMNTNIGNRGGGINMKGSGSGGMTMVSSLQPSQPLRTKVMSAPKPVIKFNTTPASTVPSMMSSNVSMLQNIIPSGSSGNQMDVDNVGLKRKREPDDSFESVE
ncbi:hypothetical protein B566_EDAN010552 [Ephemera danica]|nr:hypothetical protein B566_EDAN010552 [Ephemera danica]